MKLQKLIERMDLEVRSGRGAPDVEIRRGYVSDLLSDVIAHAQEAELWITLQTHVNIVAVASMKGLAGIILVQGREPERATVERAEKEKVPILVTKLPAYEMAGKLYDLLNAEKG
ncbi:MAG: serine kinase [Elusimicrobia bacterium]|nr:serine kinase [Elusimicrobiota bacterium]